MSAYVHSAIDVVRGFRGLRVMVVGDVMLDTYIDGAVTRICKEGPIPVLDRSVEHQAPGGAANVATNLASLGAEVSLIGLIGDDLAGVQLRKTLTDLGVSDRLLIADEHCSTMRKTRLAARGQYIVRLDEGETRSCSRAGHRRVLQCLEDEFARCDVVVISDYGYGAVCDEVIDTLRVLRQKRPVVLAVDAKQVLRFARAGATVLTPSLAEACAAAGMDSPDPARLSVDQALEIASTLRQQVDAELLSVTLSSEGVLLLDRSGEVRHLPAQRLSVASDIGAGDSFLSAVALALAANAAPSQAVQIGIDAASIAVTQDGTAVVTRQDLLRRVSLTDFAANRSPQALAAVLEGARVAGSTIVFTNGVFDLLHAGHVDLLRRAKALGDLLVVGVNSDASTRRLKGQNRPINNERDRLALVSALDPVDFAVLFEEDTPEALIRTFRPDIHVKGGDYTAADLKEAAAVTEVGARIEILPLVAGRSTTNVIDRIAALYARELAEARA